METMKDNEEWNWDSPTSSRRLWIKLDDKKYIRRFIYLDKNLCEISEFNASDVVHLKACYPSVNEYLQSKNVFQPFKNITKKKEKGREEEGKGKDGETEEEDDYINNDYFICYYKTLIKCLCAIDLLSSNARTLLLINVFDFCNVVAFDTKQKIIVIIYNYNIYIIFYDRENTYIKLVLSDVKITNDIRHEVEQFICLSNANCIYNYYNNVNNSGGGGSSSEKSMFYKFMSLFLKPIKFVTQLLPLSPSHQFLPFDINIENNDDENSNKIETKWKWDNWDMPIDFLEWNVNRKANTCSRNNVSFKVNLRDTYNVYKENTNCKNNIRKTYPLKDVCKDLLFFNYLYLYHDALIYNNIVHIDFNKFFFITLNVIEEHVCEFKTVSFFPFSYNGKSCNELIGPWSNFIFHILYDRLEYSDFMAYIV